MSATASATDLVPDYISSVKEGGLLRLALGTTWGNHEDPRSKIFVPIWLGR